MRRTTAWVLGMCACSPEPAPRPEVVQRTVTDVVYVTGGTSTTVDPLDQDGDGHLVDVDCDDLDPDAHLPDEAWDGDLLPEDVEAFCVDYCRRSVTGSVVVDETLESLDELRCLSEVGGSFVLSGNASIRSLAPLHHLTAVQGWVTVHDLPELASLEGLESLAIVGQTLDIDGVPLLTDLEPLHGLRMASAIHVSDLDGVTGLHGLGGLWDMPRLTLTSMATLRTLEGFGPPEVQSLTLESLDALEVLELDAPVTESLSLKDLPITDLPLGLWDGGLNNLVLTDLPALAEPIRVGGQSITAEEVRVEGCGSLTKVFQGEPNRLRIDELSVIGNDGLNSVVAPGAFWFVSTSMLTVNNNPALTALGNLDLGDAGPDARLVVHDNDSLPNVNGLFVAPTMAMVSVTNNEVLVDVAPLRGSDVVEELIVVNNPSLSAVQTDALVNGIDTIINLSIRDNAE